MAASSRSMALAPILSSAARTLMSTGSSKNPAASFVRRWTSTGVGSHVASRSLRDGHTHVKFSAAAANRSAVVQGRQPVQNSKSVSPVGFGSSIWRMGAVSPLVQAARTHGVLGSLQAMPFCASAEKESVGLSVKQRKRHNNLYDILAMLDNYGIGWRVTRNNWQRRYPDSYWIITRVKLSGTKRRAWGKKVWKGEVQEDGREMQVRGDHKREWRYLQPDPAHFASPEALKRAADAAPAPFYVVPDPNPPKAEEAEQAASA